VRHNKSSKQISAFTIVELAIVISVIALIISGVFISRQLVQTAKIANLAADMNKYRISLLGFENQYQFLPGDMPIADQIFDYDTVSGTSDFCLTSSKCNGNGDGLITSESSAGAHHREITHAWQHLHLAGYLDVAYEGQAKGDTAVKCTAGITCPTSNIAKKSSMFFYTYTPQAASIICGDTSTDVVTTENLTLLNLGKESTSSIHPAGIGDDAILTPIIAYYFDKKIDDGMPATGFVVSENGADKRSSCATTSNCNLKINNVAHYNVSPSVAGPLCLIRALVE
jgi:hypothetical protein